jgi:hypothetical protein
LSEREDKKDDNVFVDFGGRKLPARVQRQDLDPSVQLQDRAQLVEIERIFPADLRLEPDEVDLDQERPGCLLDDEDRHRVRIADVELEKEGLESFATFDVDCRDFEGRRSEMTTWTIYRITIFENPEKG